ncbi:peptidyl-prolyl cis-trans isomerase H isoform X7 [Petaurus breviceps papuanus]|uniref:peptidyl-prolyl cis-trans isomerase H isoform X7 n=1 Tax=Petaurus breviceps papuanus TaxID=3040969 RepID=UPI0036D78C92
MAVANSSPVNPIVFFDVSIGGQAILHRRIQERWSPYRIQGEHFSQGYKRFHDPRRRLCKCRYYGDGTGVASIYRGPFADENFKLRHSAPGLLSMANSGPSTNGCQFFITCSKCDWLDGKHVVFGKIIDGLLVMRKIENVPTGPNNKPKLPVVISQCGEM